MAVPLYSVIRDDLRRKIRSGELAPGARLPSEDSLAKSYGVARMTARHALGHLVSEGLVVRIHGSGTFVSQVRLRRSLSRLIGFTAEMRETGRSLETRLANVAVSQPSERARAALHLTREAGAIEVCRLRIVDQQPAVVQRSWLPARRFSGLLQEPFTGDSLYATLEGQYGIVPTRAQQVICAVSAEDEEVRLLAVPLGTPLLQIERTTFDADGNPFEYALSRMIPEFCAESVIEPDRTENG